MAEFQILAVPRVLVALVPPLGAYMARVYEGQPTFLDRALGPVERLIYRVSGIDAKQDQDWKAYAGAVAAFQCSGFIAVYGLLRLQGFLPLNPEQFPADSA